MKRPLGIVAVLYAGGLVLGNYFELPLSCLFAVSFAFLFGALLLPRFRSYLLWPLVIFTAWTNLALHTAIISPTDLRVVLPDQPELATVRGILTETPSEHRYASDKGETFNTTARLNVTAIQHSGASSSTPLVPNWQPASGQIVVSTPVQLPADYFQGQEVEIYGVIAPPPLPIAEGLFDYRAYLRRQEIYFELKARSAADWQSVGPRIAPPLRDRFTKWAEAALALGRPAVDESLRLEYALTLGDKTFLTDEVTEPFVRASTYHIFAVDGLRMAILFGMFFPVLRMARVPRAACGLVLIPLLWSYVALTGWSASAIRAAVMLTIVLVGWLLKRPGNVLNSLFAAALIILIWQPQQFFQAGFQLSFFVVLCILVVMPVFDNFAQWLLRPDPLLPEELRPRWRRILHTPLRLLLDLFFSSLAAWIGSIPLAAYYFHILTPLSGPANVIAVPLCGLVLASNLISLLLAGWFPPGAILFNYLGWHFMEWIRATSLWFAGWPHAYAYVAAPNLFTIGVYYFILLAVATGWLFQAKWRAWKFSLIIFLLAAWAGQWLQNRSALQLTVLPLHGGSAIYCDAPGDKNDLLVDCGNDDSVEFVMKPYLRAQGVNSLPFLALTHGDAQQIGGFKYLQALVPVAKVVTSSARFRSPAYREIIQLLDTEPTRRRVVNSGDTFCNWTALHPALTNIFSRAEDNTLVARGEFRGTRILLLSNLGRLGQEALLERQSDLRADIIVAGLPQQNEPLNDTLLAAVNPQVIIIADAKSSVTRRANRALRNRLEKRGIPVLYTSDLGAVKISLRQNHWQAETVAGLSWSGDSKSAFSSP